MPAAAIKICGINTPAALDAAIRGRADYAGLVFFPKSPRNVSPESAAALSARGDGALRMVGLFVDADDAMLAQAVEAARLDALQLHGEETPDRVAQVRAQFGLPVWKALPVASAADIDRASDYAGAADLILFDARTPKGTLPGGMGLSFDWDLLASWKGAVPWGLAGGLNPGNVAEAIARTKAPLVDTSSGVESAPGVKDADLVASFCKAVRSA
jgi:Phosphoribosylanthranilate isomerase